VTGGRRPYYREASSLSERGKDAGKPLQGGKKVEALSAGGIWQASRTSKRRARRREKEVTNLEGFYLISLDKNPSSTCKEGSSLNWLQKALQLPPLHVEGEKEGMPFLPLTCAPRRGEEEGYFS